MTAIKTLTRYFQTKMIQPPIWNALNFVIHFKFTIAHNNAKKNTAADFYHNWKHTKKSSLKSEDTFLHVQLKSTSNQQEKHKRVRSFFTLITRNCHLKNSYGKPIKKNATLRTRNLQSYTCHTAIKRKRNKHCNVLHETIQQSPFHTMRTRRRPSVT